MSALLCSPEGEPLVEIGELVGTHGIRGELRLRPFNPESEVVGAVDAVWLVRGGEPRRRALGSVRPHGTIWLVRIEGAATMDEAAALVGSRVAVLESELPDLGEREYYHYELVGLAVVDEAGEALGEVAEIVSAGGNDVLSVRSPAGERLIPMNEEAVLEVDLVRRRIVVRPPAGLFDV